MTIFYVDLPDPTRDDGYWVNVDTCDSREEAEKILNDRWGITGEHSSLFITEGDDGKPDTDDSSYVVEADDPLVQSKLPRYCTHCPRCTRPTEET